MTIYDIEKKQMDIKKRLEDINRVINPLIMEKRLLEKEYAQLTEQGRAIATAEAAKNIEYPRRKASKPKNKPTDLTAAIASLTLEQRKALIALLG